MNRFNLTSCLFCLIIGWGAVGIWPPGMTAACIQPGDSAAPIGFQASQPPPQEEEKAKPSPSEPADNPAPGQKPEAEQKPPPPPPSEEEKTKPPPSEETKPSPPEPAPEGKETSPPPQEGEKPTPEPPPEAGTEPPPLPPPAAEKPVAEPPPQAPMRPVAEPSQQGGEAAAGSPPPPPMKAPTPEPPAEATSAGRVQKSLSEELAAFTQIFTLPRLILTLLILILTYFAAKFITLLFERMAKRRTEYASWLRRSIPFINLSLWFLAVLVIAGIFAHSLLAVLLLVAGVALAVGVASQPLLRDLVGGIVIVLERPFQIGDRITISGYYGEVTTIGLRSFHLMSPDGSVIIIPNAEIMRQSIANANPGTRDSQITAELLLPANVDIEAAKQIAFEAAVVSPYVYMNKPVEVQVDEEYRSELLIKLIVKAHVLDAQYERQLRSDIVEWARKGFQREISITQRPRR